MRRQVARVDLGGFAALFIALRSLRLCAEFFRVPGLLEGVKRMDDFEVKADALEGAFDAVLAAEAVDELKASVAALKRSEEHTSDLQSLMRISYAVLRLT